MEIITKILFSTYKFLKFTRIPSFIYNSYIYIIETTLKKFGIKYFLVTLFSGKKMILDVEDKGLSQDLLFDPIKHREKYASTYIIDYFSKNKGDVFFDLGCNLGYYSILLSDYFDKIIGVEPVNSSCEICTLNSQINDFSDKFEIINGAVFYESGYVEHDNNKSKNLVRVNKSNKKTNTKAYTISEICEMYKIKKIDFLKMDIEGGEYDLIVKGRKDFFKFAPKKIFIELHLSLFTKEQSIELFNIFKEEGYYIERVFTETKNKGNLLGIFSGIYEKMQKKLLSNKVGEIYKDMTIDEIIKEEYIIEKRRCMEFIFNKK